MILFTLQAGLLIAVVHGDLDFRIYIEAHLLDGLLPAGALLLIMARYGAGRTRLDALQIVAWSAFGGAFGAFVGMTIAFTARDETAVRALRPPGADGLNDGVDIDAIAKAHIGLLDRRVRIEGAARVRPIVDVLADGSRLEKLEALRVMYRRHERTLSVLLKQALRDTDNSVRVLAATVMAKLHGTFSRDIGDRQTDAAEAPDQARAWRLLAQSRLAYAGSGLMEPSRGRTEVEIALADLTRAIVLDSSDATLVALFEETRETLAALDGSPRAEETDERLDAAAGAP